MKKILLIAAIISIFKFQISILKAQEPVKDTNKVYELYDEEGDIDDILEEPVLDTLADDIIPDSLQNMRYRPRIIARTYGDSIVLRWVIEDAGVWMASRNSGWMLYRSSSEDSTLYVSPTGDTMEYFPVTKRPLKPMSLEDMQKVFTPDNLYAGAAAQALYGTMMYQLDRDMKGGDDFMSVAFRQYQEQKQRHMVAMMAADCDPQVATALGLRFVDRNVKPGEMYEYTLVSMMDTDLAMVEDVSILLDNLPYERGNDEKVPEVRFTQLDAYRVAVRWVRNKLSGYWLERSSDGEKSYRKLNTAPVWAINPTKETAEVYGDSIAAWMVDDVVFFDSIRPDSTYRYRLKAFDAFGDNLDWRYSDNYKPLDLIPPATPIVDPVYTTGNRYCLITWKVAQKDDDLLGYYVAFSPSDANQWQTISPLIAPADPYYVDSIADIHGRGLYRVFAIDTAGNVSYSPAVHNMIEDMYPPAKPQGLEGIAKMLEETDLETDSVTISDTLAIVYLRWQPNTDPDLLAYRVYFANQKDHEFIERTQGYITDTFFVDTVDVYSLTREIYYYVIAVDRSHNFSATSDTLRIALPDVIPPSVCLLENLRQEGDTIIIDWLPSASTDVQRYVVYRKLRPAVQWQILTILDSLDDNPAIIQRGESTLIHLADTPEPNSIPYAWAIEAQDSAGNTSGISGQCVAQVAPSKEFQIDINLKASFDKKKKNVTLSWKYDYQGKRDYYGVIYRSVDGGEFKDIDTFYPGDKNYTDHNAPEGSQCTYYIELRLPKGVVSNPSNNAKVSVK